MRKKVFGLLLVCLLLCPGLTGLAKIDSPEVQECKKVYKECREIMNRASTRKILYVREYANRGFGPWRLYDEKVKGEWINQIEMYISGSKLRVALYFLTNPGYDTMQFTEYYFRADGTTAYITNDFRTAWHTYSIITDIYIDTRKQTQKTVRFFDRNTRKELDAEDKSEGSPPLILLNTMDFLKRHGISLKDI